MSASSIPVSTVTYRQLGANNDPVWGQGSSNFLSGAQAVAQAVQTRLQMFQGEWWESLLDGLPLWQKILGVSTTEAQVGLLVQQRILGTPYVSGITNLSVEFASPARSFSISATVQTVFGQVSVDYAPQPTAQGIP